MKINIGKDFSENPAGRSIEKDGDDSGEAFRERHLKPSLESLAEGEIIEIVLDDGVISYGSSFISEAFGALVREGYITASDFISKLKFTYETKPSHIKKPYMAVIADRIVENINSNSLKT